MIYTPAEDSYLLQKYVKKYAKNKSILDIGTGQGIQAITALNSKAKSVTAIDINKEAIESLKTLQPKINSIHSNLFSKVAKGSNFDLIIFNPPYLPLDNREPKQSRLATTGGRQGDEIILRFLKKVTKYLNKNGKVLLVLSSLTPQKKIIFLLKELELVKKILSKQKVFMETLEVWEIKHNNP